MSCFPLIGSFVFVSLWIKMGLETFEQHLRYEIIDQKEDENNVKYKCQICFEEFNDQHLQELHISISHDYENIDTVSKLEIYNNSELPKYPEIEEEMAIDIIVS